MKYMGSKRRIAKHILPIMLNEAENHGITTWVEPFVGGGNMITKVPDTYERIGYDINKYLIAFYDHILLNGFTFTEQISKDLYSNVRKYYNGKDIGGLSYSDAFVGWVGFMASANGRFFDGGYSGISRTVNGKQRDYIKESINGIKKEIDLYKGVSFQRSCFSELSFNNCLIYCDPPYYGVKSYSRFKFPRDLFYDWCIEQSRNNLIFISENNMPVNFKEVWVGELSGSIGNKENKIKKDSLERLFTI